MSGEQIINREANKSLNDNTKKSKQPRVNINHLLSKIREEKNKMNDIIMGNFSLDVAGRKVSLDKVNEKLTEKETEILWKLLNKNYFESCFRHIVTI